MKRVMFIAPRFHTNQYASVKSLLNNDVSVRFLVQNIEIIENHEDVIPIKIGFSRASNVILNMISKSYGELEKKRLFLNYGIPPIGTLVAEILKFNPDVVILRERIPYSLVCNVICRFLRVKTILYTQEPLYNSCNDVSLKSVYIMITKPLLPKHRITPVYGNISTGKKDKSTTFVPFVMNRSLTKKCYVPDGSVRFLMVAKYQKIKRIFESVQIFKKLLDNGYTNWSLTVCGVVDNVQRREIYNTIESYVAQNNMGDRVTLKQNIDHNEMERVYIENDVSILASYRDYASVTPIEAMSHGLVNISSDGNGTHTYINNGIDGFVFNKNDMNELYNIIVGILENVSVVETMGTLSIEKFNQQFSSQNYFEKLLGVYNRIK